MQGIQPSSCTECSAGTLCEMGESGVWGSHWALGKGRPPGLSSDSLCTESGYNTAPKLFPKSALNTSTQQSTSIPSGKGPVPCPAGHYCTMGTQSAIPCPSGKYYPNQNAKKETDCLSCPGTKYCVVNMTKILSKMKLRSTVAYK